MTSSPPMPDENVFGHRRKLDFLRRQISGYLSQHPGQSVRLLDVGCSNGQHVTIHLGDLGTDVLAIDPYKPSIQYAIDNNPYPDSIEFRCTTIEDLHREDTFDIIVMADVLEHLEDPGKLLDQARGHLPDDGILLVSIPNGYGPFEIENALDKKGCLIPSYLLFNFLSGLKGLITGRERRRESADEPEPYAYECGHVQFWTFHRFTSLLNNHLLKITEMHNGPWLGALCTSTWWGRSRGFCRWNSRMGDYLPRWMVSAWYLQIGKSEV